MQQQIEVRLACLEDLPALEKIGEALFDYAVKLPWAREFLNDPRHHLVLALDDDQIVGMASAFHYIHPDKEPTLFVNEASVLEAYRSRGIARNMIRHLCQHGRSLGCTDAWVATEASNLPARKAYAAAGGIEDPEPVVLIELKSLL